MVLLFAGCSRPAAKPVAKEAPANASDFAGEKWTGTMTMGGTCSDGTKVPGISNQQAIGFVPLGSGQLEYTNSLGCKFQFAITGNTAKLTNGPVTCTATDDNGEAGSLNYEAMTASTSDGHNLKVTITSNVKAGPKTCNILGSGTFKR
jgi:hypothetical protein